MCVSATADEPGDDVHELDPLEARGRAEAAPRPALALGLTRDIEAADLTDRLAGTLADILAWEPGITASFYSPAASRPIVRGLDGYRVGVFENRLGTGDVSDTSPDHAVAMDPAFMRRVTVYKGTPALRFGGAAIGGAVDIDGGWIPQPDATPHTRLLAQAETVNDGRLAAAEHTAAAGSTLVRGQALYREAGDYRIPGYARTEAYDEANHIRLPPTIPAPAPNPHGRVPNTGMRARSAGVGALTAAGGWEIGAAANGYFTDYGVPTDGHSHGNPFSEPGETAPSAFDPVRIDLENLRVLSVARRPAQGDGTTLDTRGRFSRFRQDEREGAFLTNSFRRTEAEARGEVLRSTQAGGLLSGGLSAFRADYRNRNTSYFLGRPIEDILTSRDHGGAVFALAEQPVGQRWTVEAGAHLGIRHAARRDPPEGFPEDLRSRRFATLSTAAGLRFQVTPALEVSLHLAEGRRGPASEELFIEAPHEATGIYRIPDPALRQERVRSAEVVALYRGERLLLQANAFVRDFDGFIFLRNQGFEIEGLVAYRHVQSPARFHGLEGTARFALWTEAERRVYLQVDADLLRGQDRGRDQPLPRIPPARVSARLAAETEWLSAFFETRRAFAQNRVPDSVFGTLAHQAPTPAYTFLNAGLSIPLATGSSDFRFILRGENLLNREARHHPSFLKDIAPLPGRSVRAGIEWTF
ncbi:MAG: TonB-dependent receptor [Opitutales bacterium]|nr:TonB-dependent receptor [Opitutales bacterium]